MASTLMTPGLYIEEKNAFPSSAVAVETAVPVFIGYTEKAAFKGESLLGKPVRITSFAEYIERFGGAFNAKFRVSKNAEHGSDVWQLSLQENNTAYFYNSIRLFYANGGGPCYIFPVGLYEEKEELEIRASDFSDPEVYATLEKEYEPTLVIMPDLIALGAGAYPVYRQVLQHCEKVQSRFSILDLAQATAGGSSLTDDVVKEFREQIGSNALKYGAAYYPWLKTAIVQPGEISERNISFSSDEDIPEGEVMRGLLGQARAMLNVLPPSGAMAGVYTMVDNTRGVWKAPANVSVNMVNAPTVNVSHEGQETLNVDVQEGKSINVIRTFPGIGTLVWGGRTLDGNSLDWRYINVRRTLIMIEQSLKLATRAYVFEPNDANTWMTVKSMIANFLTNLWKQGALAGQTPEQAFDVQLGLGSTMTPTDVLEGKTLISVKVAIVRPAEFIVITFEQELQQS